MFDGKRRNPGLKKSVSKKLLKIGPGLTFSESTSNELFIYAMVFSKFSSEKAEVEV
jgi:hypothetical protein